jgi:hypothetical protein
MLWLRELVEMLLDQAQWCYHILQTTLCVVMNHLVLLNALRVNLGFNVLTVGSPACVTMKSSLLMNCCMCVICPVGCTFLWKFCICVSSAQWVVLACASFVYVSHLPSGLYLPVQVLGVSHLPSGLYLPVQVLYMWLICLVGWPHG